MLGLEKPLHSFNNYFCTQTVFEKKYWTLTIIIIPVIYMLIYKIFTLLDSTSVPQYLKTETDQLNNTQ